MMKIALHYPLAILCSVVLLLTVACGGSGGDPVSVSPSQVAEKIDGRIQAAETALGQLNSSLDKNLVRNALMLKEYSRILKQQNSTLAPLLVNLEKDAGAEGALFQNLSNRLQQVRDNPEFFESPVARYQEVNSIVEAARPENFNNALIDVVNAVADMSNGMLPRIAVPPKSESLASNNAQDLGAGSQLIGNPAYGQWTNQGGTSIWEWYGMYAMFRDLVGGRSYSYGQWDRTRDWSYYSDIGRNKHGSYRKGEKSYAPSSKKSSTVRDYGVSRKSYGSGSAERRASTYSQGSVKKPAVNKKSASMPGSFRHRSTFSRGVFGGK